MATLQCLLSAEELPPASRMAGVLGKRRRLPPCPPSVDHHPPSVDRRLITLVMVLLLDGRHHDLGQRHVERVRATRHARRTEQHGPIDDRDGAEGIGGRAVDVVGDATVLLCPTRLEGNGVLLEVVNHV